MSEVETAHASLVAVANAQHCRSSVLTPGKVSMHTLPETASFANIEALASTAKAASDAMYVATQGQDLVFSVRLSLAPKNGNGSSERDEEEHDGTHRPKKRRRDTSAEEADRVACARSRLAKSAPSLPSSELDIAQQILTKLVLNLRGPNGEIVVQSYALLSKKLGADDERSRVVVAARLNAGIELKVDQLKGCLGVCWKDGLLTTLPTLQGIGKLELPLSEEAAAAAYFGNMSLLLVTSVPAKRPED
ncbi:MAG: hypothetical protein CMD92_06855 [Gammaproteobacteria bacterium]|nr:hypothetical protein [Gammaproteobacteria bacterium]